MILSPWKGMFFIFILDNCFRYHLSKYFICCFYKSYDIPQVLQRRTFQCWKYYIKGAPYSGLFYTKLFKKIKISWMNKYSYFTCFTKLLFCVSLSLNRWKDNMISVPSKYLLFIVGYQQRSVPLLLHEFQCCCYLKDLPIGDIVFCCSYVEVELSIDYRH